MADTGLTHITIEPSPHWPQLAKSSPVVITWAGHRKIKMDSPSSDSTSWGPRGKTASQWQSVHATKSLETMIAQATKSGLGVVDTRKGERWDDGNVLDKDGKLLRSHRITHYAETRRQRLAPALTEGSRVMVREITSAGSVGGGLARPMVSNEPENGDDDTWRQKDPQNVSGSPLAPTAGSQTPNPADEFYSRYGIKNTTPAALHSALTQFAHARGMTPDQTRDLQTTLDTKYNMRAFGRVYNQLSDD